MDRMYGPLALHTTLTFILGLFIGYSASLQQGMIILSIPLLIGLLFIGWVTVHSMYLGLGASMEND